VMVLLRKLGHGAMSVLSHAGDGTIEGRCRCRVMLATVLLSHSDDSAAEVI
jgi:hypothetical protein